MAVAVKKLGFTNIKIYNGGLKDWIKNGLEVKSIDPLPSVPVRFINNIELLKKMEENQQHGCPSVPGENILTIIDFRSSLQLAEKRGGDQYRIKTGCRTITAMLDDFLHNHELVNLVPRSGLVVTVSETGNRDQFLIRYLHSQGYDNVVGLRYGMRGWLKADYPVERITTEQHR